MDILGIYSQIIMGRMLDGGKEFLRYLATNTGKSLIRAGLSPVEIYNEDTGFLILQVNEVTTELERVGLLQFPTNREVVEFGQKLRSVALPAVLKRGLVGLEDLGPIRVPEDTAGDIVEQVLAFEYAGKQNPNAWKTEIAQLWLTRDTSDPINIRRQVMGTSRLRAQGYDD